MNAADASVADVLDVEVPIILVLAVEQVDLAAAGVQRRRPGQSRHRPAQRAGPTPAVAARCGSYLQLAVRGQPHHAAAAPPRRSRPRCTRWLAAISFHIGDPGDLVKSQPHDAGILWIQQVFDLDQARLLADRWRADATIAQERSLGGRPLAWSEPWLRVPRSSTSPAASRSPLPASPTVAVWPLRSFSAPRESTWAPASWPAPRCGSVNLVEAGNLARRWPRRGRTGLRRRGPAAAVARRRAGLPFPGLGSTPSTWWNQDVSGSASATRQLRDQVRTAAADGRLDQSIPFTGPVRSPHPRHRPRRSLQPASSPRPRPPSERPTG